MTIQVNRLDKSFSRGSGNGGQNLHASHSRCLIKFNLNQSSDWLPVKTREAFLQLHGEFITSRGTVVIVNEKTRSPSDNEKLAMKQLQDMLDKAETLASLPPREEDEYLTNLERIRASKTEAELERYKDRILASKKLKSAVKKNRRKIDPFW